MPAYDILVRGAGAVGLAGALALSRRGFQVALLGRLVAPAEEDLRAYALNAQAVTLLSQLKVWDAMPADARTAVHDMHIEGDRAGAVLEFSAWTEGVSELAWIVDAGALEAALREAVRFAPHVTVVDAPVAAELTLLAEGKDSAARAELGVSMQRQFYGHKAVAARLIASEPHAGLARQWFRSPDILALLPFDRPQSGASYGLVWSAPDARADALLALDAQAFEAELMRATAGAAGTLTLGTRRAAWPLSIGRAERVFGPGWVLAGDAAHVVHPLAGQGLNLGLADIATLAEVLAARESWRALGDERLLARYARERELQTVAMGALTDGLLHLFAHPSPWVAELRNRGLSLLNQLSPLKRALAQRAFGR